MTKEEQKLVKNILKIARDKNGRGVLLIMIDIIMKSLEDKEYAKELKEQLSDVQ